MSNIFRIKDTIDRVLASADLTFHIIDGLTLKVSGGADMSSALREVYEPKETNTGYNANGIAQQQNRRSSSYSNENILTYIKKFGVHSLNVMVGSSLLYEENKTSSMTAATSSATYTDITIWMPAHNGTNRIQEEAKALCYPVSDVSTMS